MGRIEAICISQRKGVVKKEIDSAVFEKDYGIVGDAHAGNWHRQISLLARESIELMKEKIPQLANGAFAENLITGGISIAELTLGTRLKLGEDIILEVTQIGKKCHKSCAIKTLVGDCIMPREGIFCRVIQGGQLTRGDALLVEKTLLPQSANPSLSKPEDQLPVEKDIYA